MSRDTRVAVRWGILGTARINRRLIPPMRAAARSTLVAVASRDAAHADRYANEWEIPVAVGGYAALLAREDIDAVYIPLPNGLHVEWVLAAIDAGKHVLCEKPMALVPADVDRIADAAAMRSVVVEEGYMYRHEPLTARVVQLIRDGAVGAVRTIVSGFTYAQGRSADARLRPELGGGALWDVGCYPVSYTTLLTGRDATTAVGSANWHDSGVDEEFAGLLRFPGGITSTVYAGFRGAYRTWFDVVGSIGSLTVTNPFKPGPLETLRLDRLGDTQQIEVAGSPVLFLHEVQHFVNCVLDGAPATVSLQDSRRIASTIAALQASARSETPPTSASPDLTTE